MAWEMFDSSSRKFKTGAEKYGASWEDRPMIVITKNGVVCNKSFCTAYGYTDKERINVHFDARNRRLGFSKPATDEALKASYAMAKCGGGLMITCMRAGKVFSDCLGEPSPAQLNSGDRIVEAQLS